MEKIADIIKLFLEKHLIKTLLSFVISVIVFAVRPNLFGLRDKIGNMLFLLTIFCISFLICSFLSFLIKRITEKKSYDKMIDEINKAKAKESIKSLWKFVDSLNPQDRQYLMSFIKSNNSPISVSGSFYSTGLFSNSDLVVTTTCTENTESLGTDKKSNTIPFFVQTKTLYKLNDDFYLLLKHSYDTYGKISNFTTEENENG